jgi:hypothetical protein
MSLPSLLMSIAAKAFALAILVGAVVSCPSGAEILRVDRIEIEVPDGGMTQPRPARSISRFKHRLLDLTMTVEVDSAIYYDPWRRRCMPEKVGPYAAPYQGGTLARTDQYLYSKTVSKFSNSGFYAPSGSWSEHCLVFRSGELAAQMMIRLPTSALESGEITATEIEKVFASARLTINSIEDRGTRDPRLVLEIPDDFVPTGLPTYTFHLNHNRLPLYISVWLSDPATYETAKLRNTISAMLWEVGSLARTDEYFYYFIRPGSFALGFRTADATAEINVSVNRSSLDSGDITVEEIERMLAGARMIPAGEGDKK